MTRLFPRLRTAGCLLAGSLMMLSAAHATAAEAGQRYRVTITNITKGQTFTPQLVVAHRGSLTLFTLGQAASDGLEILAEDGNTAALTAEVRQKGASAVTIGGLLAPGSSASTVINVKPGQTHISVAAMLIPTNDAFMAVNAIRLPGAGQAAVSAPAYEAGTESNDQNCQNIPGPLCGGAGHSPGPNAGDEGFVHVSNGFNELAPDVGGDVLAPFTYDWRNPVAQVVVQRVH